MTTVYCDCDDCYNNDDGECTLDRITMSGRMTEQNLKDLGTIKDYYTYDTQSRQAVEEMAELIQAINKFWRKEMNCGYDLHEDDKDKNYREHIAEEIADVYICLKQMEMFLDIENDVKGYIDYKICRQLNRIVNNK